MSNRLYLEFEGNFIQVIGPEDLAVRLSKLLGAAWVAEPEVLSDGRIHGCLEVEGYE